MKWGEEERETREEKKGREREGRERGENHEIEKIQPGKHK